MAETSPNEETMSELAQDLELKMKFTDEFHEDHEEFDENDEEEEEEEEEFSFDFAFEGLNLDQISAKEAFDNDQIKQVFPLFNRDLLLDVEDLENLKLNDRLPNVKKVFVEAISDGNTTPSSDYIVGPYCEWSKKPAVEVVEQPQEGCKKSNSTGFSKIWRFKDFIHRSNSDGKDAFVFLNNKTAPSGSTSAAAATKEDEKKEDSTQKKVYAGEALRKVNGDGEVNGRGIGVEGEVKKVKKGKKVIKALSPHEVYLRSKAKEGGRRAYLPYRPELVGFFTNVNGGGLTRNVHPF